MCHSHLRCPECAAQDGHWCRCSRHCGTQSRSASDGARKHSTNSQALVSELIARMLRVSNNGAGVKLIDPVGAKMLCRLLRRGTLQVFGGIRLVGHLWRSFALRDVLSASLFLYVSAMMSVCTACGLDSSCSMCDRCRGFLGVSKSAVSTLRSGQRNGSCPSGCQSLVLSVRSATATAKTAPCEKRVGWI